MTSAELRDANRGELLEWLLACCRAWLAPGPETSDRWSPEWPARAAFAWHHDLEPLLHHLASVERALLHEAPSAVRERWEAAYYRNYVFNTELVELTADLAARAREAGTELLVFKGPVTAARGWGDLALRVMADVDLLCRPADLPRLSELARALGLVDGEQTSAHHVVLRHPTLPASFELHHRHYDVVSHLPEEWAWSTIETVDVGEVSLPALPVEAAAVIDVAHLVEHDLQLSLKPLLDLAATLRRQAPRFDGARFAELLGDARLTLAFDRLMTLLEGTLGLPLPAGLASSRSPHPQALSRDLLERLRHPDQLHVLGPREGPHRRDGAVATLAYGARRLFPSVDELKAIRGTRSTLAALAGWPAHAAATLGRATARWRASRGTPSRPATASLKAEVVSARNQGVEGPSDSGPSSIMNVMSLIGLVESIWIV